MAEKWYEYIPGWNLAQADDKGDKWYSNIPGYELYQLYNDVILPNVKDSTAKMYQEAEKEKNQGNSSKSDFLENVNNVLTIGKDDKNSALIDKIDTYVNNALTGDLDYQRQLEMLEKEQAFNSAEAEKNRLYNTQMSNTAYQRQATDLKRAGFNPALVLSGGGANTINSNVPFASQQHTGMHPNNLLPFVGSIVSSAFNFAMNQNNNNTKLKIAELQSRKNSSATTYKSVVDSHKSGSLLPDISSKNVRLKDIDYDKADDLSKALYDLFVRK